MGMCIRIYLLPGRDGDRSKVVYPLSLRMEMRINFYYGDEDVIMIPVPVPPSCHPYLVPNEQTSEKVNCHNTGVS